MVYQLYLNDYSICSFVLLFSTNNGVFSCDFTVHYYLSFLILCAGTNEKTAHSKINQNMKVSDEEDRKLHLACLAIFSVDDCRSPQCFEGNMSWWPSPYRWVLSYLQRTTKRMKSGLHYRRAQEWTNSVSWKEKFTYLRICAKVVLRFDRKMYWKLLLYMSFKKDNSLLERNYRLTWQHIAIFGASGSVWEQHYDRQSNQVQPHWNVGFFDDGIQKERSRRIKVLCNTLI